MDNSHRVLFTKCSNRIKIYIRLKKEKHSEDDIIGLASLTGRLMATFKFQVDVAQRNIIDTIVNNHRREIEIKDIIDFESDYRDSYNIDQVTYTMKNKHLLPIIRTLRKVRGRFIVRIENRSQRPQQIEKSRCIS